MPQMTPQEFARRIKAKYPTYAHLSDEELTARMLDRYPEYKSEVAMDARTGLEARKVNPSASRFGDPNGSPNPTRGPLSVAMSLVTPLMARLMDPAAAKVQNEAVAGAGRFASGMVKQFVPSTTSPGAQAYQNVGVPRPISAVLGTNPLDPVVAAAQGTSMIRGGVDQVSNLTGPTRAVAGNRPPTETENVTAGGTAGELGAMLIAPKLVQAARLPTSTALGVDHPSSIMNTFLSSGSSTIPKMVRQNMDRVTYETPESRIPGQGNVGLRNLDDIGWTGSAKKGAQRSRGVVDRTQQQIQQLESSGVTESPALDQLRTELADRTAALDAWEGLLVNKQTTGSTLGSGGMITPSSLNPQSIVTAPIRRGVMGAVADAWNSPLSATGRAKFWRTLAPTARLSPVPTPIPPAKTTTPELIPDSDPFASEPTPIPSARLPVQSPVTAAASARTGSPGTPATAPRLPVKQPPVDRVAEVNDLYDKRNALVAVEADKFVNRDRSAREGLRYAESTPTPVEPRQVTFKDRSGARSKGTVKASFTARNGKQAHIVVVNGKSRFVYDESIETPSPSPKPKSTKKSPSQTQTK